MYKLREQERKDIAEINSWRNDEDLIKSLTAPYRYINNDVDIMWFQQYMSNRSSNVRCAVVDSQDTIIALVSLTDIDYLNQSADFRLMVGKESNRGKGIGTFAVMEMLKHAFENLNLNRVELTVLSDNEVAKHLYEKCGFIYEGRKRKSIYKRGKFVDILIYSILREEFERKTSEQK